MMGEKFFWRAHKAALLRSPGFATILSYELGNIVGKKILYASAATAFSRSSPTSHPARLLIFSTSRDYQSAKSNL